METAKERRGRKGRKYRAAEECVLLYALEVWQPEG